MRAKIALLVSASLLAGAIAAQPVPCASVAPEVRDRVREAGACRDADDDAATKAAPAPSDTVTMKLSDGTVVRIPREISSNINDGRKRAATNEPAPPKSVPPRAGKSAQSGPGASGDPPLAPQKLQVPDVIGRSDADAGSALAEFKVDRTQTASAAPAGEVLAQEPAPASLVLPGSTVTLQVSDGSLAGGAGMPATTEAPPSAPLAAAVPAPAPVVELVPPATRTGELATRGFPIVFSANSALVLGTGVSLGLILGALLMRQWLLRRELMTDQNAAAPAALYQNQPVDTPSGDSATEVMSEVRFAARRDPGETTIEFVAFADDEAVAIEQSSEQHG